MRFAWALLTAGAAMAVLLISSGCGKKTDASPDASTAAIRGSGTGSQGDSSPASQNAGRDKDLKKQATSDPYHPVVEIQTNLGNFQVELDASQAPLTVDNFLRYVDSGYYDRTIFHQVLRDYVVMGGAYTADLAEKRPHPSIRNEAQRCALKNVAGTIAMVRKPDAPDSATCQFFINVADNPNLDYKGPKPEEYGYCPFGKITSGMDVVKKIAAVDVTDKTADVPGKNEKAEFERLPRQSVVLQSVRRIR